MVYSVELPPDPEKLAHSVKIEWGLDSKTMAQLTKKLKALFEKGGRVYCNLFIDEGTTKLVCGSISSPNPTGKFARIYVSGPKNRPAAPIETSAELTAYVDPGSFLTSTINEVRGLILMKRMKLNLKKYY